jgi:hypothetical protein
VYKPPLDDAEFDAYLDALASSAPVRTHVSVLDQNEDHRDSLTEFASNRLISGSVTVDSTADVSRSLEATFFDPKRRLRLEANNPAHGALYSDRFIAVRWQIYVADVVKDWVSIPIFWGPITGLSRAGAELTIEAQGKEARMLAPFFATQGYTIHKGTTLRAAIKRVAEKCGETKFDLPELSHKLHNSRSVLPTSEPWKVISGGEEDDRGKKVGGLIDKSPDAKRRIYYSGDGQLTIRRFMKDPCFTFRRIQGGDRNHLLAEPDENFDTLAYRNFVDVTGAKTSGKKKAHGVASLPASHPLSPEGLRHNGAKVYQTEFVEVDGLKTDKACEKRAEDDLDRLATEGIEPSFDCLPIPHLEEDDRVRLRTSEFEYDFTLKQFTIPLTSDTAMGVGTDRKTGKPRRGRKHRRPRSSGGVGPSRGGRGHGHV